MYFNDFCTENTERHKRLYKKKNLHKKFKRTNLGVYSTRNKAIGIWNTIPGKIKQSVSINKYI